MKQIEKKLWKKKQVLLEQMGSLSLMVQGSYLERFSVCSRPNCACHRGQKHGPRYYLVVYHDKKQRQVYVPQAQRDVILQGLNQHEQLLAIVKQITRINLELMRAGRLTESAAPPRKKGARHE